MKLVLFDCDGTLVDSVDVIHRCMAATFADFGHPEPEVSLTRSIIGLSLELAVARMLACEVDERICAMTARYKEHFVAHRMNGAPIEPLFAGIAELIADCRGEPALILGVVTGKSRRGLAAVLGHHGMARHFFTTRTADDCPSKPHPAMVLECCAEVGVDPKETLVVGDATFDMEMARAAGATAIGVSWGYGEVEALRAAGAHHIAHSASELRPLIGLKGAIHA